jgi:hypothetical protein
MKPPSSSSSSSSNLMIQHPKLMTIGEAGGHTIKETNLPLMPAGFI